MHNTKYKDEEGNKATYGMMSNLYPKAMGDHAAAIISKCLLKTRTIISLANQTYHAMQ
jgi:hypothetical protein